MTTVAAHPAPRFLRRATACAVLGAACLFGAIATPLASAQGADVDAGFVQRLNDLYRGRDRAVPDARRADLVLLPALASMDAPPASASTPLRAALIGPGMNGWSEAEGWAGAATQQAALTALRTVGDPAGRFAFLMAYGREGVSQDLVRAGLFVDLGEPPILAAAQFRYFEGLDRLAALVHVEATRLANDDRATEASTLLIRWVFFARQMADREFLQEKLWADRAMRMGLERLRDVVHEHESRFTEGDIREIVRTLDARAVMLERLRLPQGDRLAAQQVIDRAFRPGGGADAGAYGPTMARIASAARPLSMFGEAARWQDSAAGQAGTYDTIDELKDVYEDWMYRWDLSPFDNVIRNKPSDYDSMDKQRFATIDTIVGQVRELFGVRQRLDAEFSGTRMSLAVAAFHRRHSIFPDVIAAVRPTFIARLETDPFSRDGADFHYFVPTRGQARGPRDTVTPHTMMISLPNIEAEIDAESQAMMDTMVDAIGEVGGDIFELRTAAARSGGAVDPQRLQEIMTRFSERIEGLTGGDDGDTRRATNPGTARMINDRMTRAMMEQMQALMASTGGAPPTKEQVIEGFRAGMQKVFDELKGGFTVELDDSTFVLYSVGPQGQRGWARTVGHGGEDLLFWPPILSMLRREMIEIGESPDSLAGAWIDYQPMQAPVVAAQPTPEPEEQRTRQRQTEPTRIPPGAVPF